VIVVADASPLRYLILIDHAHVLRALYGRVIVPPAVISELNQERTPELVRNWLSASPDWLVVQAPQQALPLLDRALGTGEREAIALAAELSADALLMDDRDGRREAEKRNLVVLGTLRVLADAAEHGFIDLATAFDRLRQTNFRGGEQLLQQLLEHAARRSQK
jgi:predicted nucleic acid-binding protein